MTDEVIQDRSSEMFLALALLGALNVLDILTTYAVLGNGGVEVNPIASFFLDNGTLAVVKIGVWALLVALCSFRQQSATIIRYVWMCTALYVFVVGNNLFHLATSA